MPRSGATSNPDQLAPLYQDLDRIPLWVEETLRYDTSSQLLARVVSGELNLYDTTIPDGDILLLLPGSAHRDERVFDEPRRLRDRPRNRFEPDEFRQRRPLLPRRAPGPHGSPGGARPSCSSESADIEVDEANAVRVHSSSVRGFAHLPMTPAGGPLDAALRTPARAQTRARRGRVVRYRRRDGDRACRARLSGRARRPPGREVPGDRRQDQGRRRRGRRRSTSTSPTPTR